MNLFPKKTGLLIILGALFFISCKNADEILLDPNTDPNQRGTFLDTTFSASTSTILLDKFSTSSEQAGENYMLFGSYNDSDFGPITASSFIEAGATDAKIPTDSVEYLSFQIQLDLDYRTGEFTSPQKVIVHRLEESLYRKKMEDRAYSYNSPATVEGDILATGEIRPDSFITNKGLLRIALPQQLGQEFYQNLQESGKITSQEKFISFFKGISLRGDLGNLAVFGASRDSSYIELSYRTTNKNKGDTINVRFPFRVYHYNKIDINRANALNKPNTSYIQSSTGVLSKIQFPSILKLKDLNKNIAINKAELEISLTKEPNVTPPNNLFLIAGGYFNPEKSTDSLVQDKDRVGQLDEIFTMNFKTIQESLFYQDQVRNINSRNVMATKVADPLSKDTTFVYKADISSYVEAILKDDQNLFSPEVILYPEAFGNMVNPYFSYSFSTLNGGQVGSTNKDLTLNKAVIQNHKIKLKIYYTLLD